MVRDFRLRGIWGFRVFDWFEVVWFGCTTGMGFSGLLWNGGPVMSSAIWISDGVVAME